MQGTASTACKARTIQKNTRPIYNACGIALIVSKYTATGGFFVKLKKRNRNECSIGRQIEGFVLTV